MVKRKLSSWNGTAATMLSAGVSLVGCGSDDDTGSGSLTVLLEPEDTITEGIEPGDGVENMRDGWAVAYDRFIVAVGDIDVHFSTDESLEAEAGDGVGDGSQSLVRMGDVGRIPYRHC